MRGIASIVRAPLRPVKPRPPGGAYWQAVMPPST
jgi:hypothetical protein